MPAAKLNLPPIEKGATYKHSLIWKDGTGVLMDLVDCQAKMQVREAVESDIVLIELSTSNGRITIIPVEGKIDLYVSDEDSSILETVGGVYDLEIYHPNGETTRLIEGKIIFKPEVTR